MNKAKLIEIMVKESKISKSAAAKALDAVINGITSEMKKKDGKVTLIGFGTFQKTHRKARIGRNPQTGEPINIKASNTVSFKPGKKLKDSIN
jgi:DNA-binding protein HU-beta